MNATGFSNSQTPPAVSQTPATPPAHADDRFVLTHRYKLMPTRAQHAALAKMLEAQRLLYNAALEERIGAWRLAKKGITKFDQMKSLTVWRGFDEDAASVPLKLQRWTIARVDGAFKGFFSRLKTKSGKAGFPRFRSKSRWRSFGFAEFSGIRLDGRRLRFRGLPGGLRMNLHRPLPKDARLLSCGFSRDGRAWHVSLQIETAKAERRPLERAVGIDPGISSLMALSDGTMVENPKVYKRHQKELRRRQRALSRCRRGSKRRAKVRARLIAINRRIAETRRTKLHQATAAIVRAHDFIAVEAPNVKGLARGMLAREMHDAGWSTLFSMLRYKAERAGALLMPVDPRHTSQLCSGCGAHVPKELDQRTHICPDCGLNLDRDVNAARNILARAVVGPGLVNVAGCGVRRAGKLREKMAA